MQALKRAALPKYSQSEIDLLVKKAFKIINIYSQPLKVLLFGSAVTGTFDDWSDLDFVLVFETKKEALNSRKKLYHHSVVDNHTIDFICVDRESFERRSQLGGVLFVARTEGVELNK